MSNSYDEASTVATQNKQILNCQHRRADQTRVGNFYPHVVLTMVKTPVKTGLGKTPKTCMSWAKLGKTNFLNSTADKTLPVPDSCILSILLYSSETQNCNERLLKELQ